MNEQKRKDEAVSPPAFDRVLFLDFDGVLHPSGGKPGYSLPFCWVPELAEDLAFHGDVGLVVHSSWMERYSVEDMREFLEPLGPRLLGAVGPGIKAQSVLAFLRAHPEIRQWLVIDDDASQFGSEFNGSLLSCDPATGLSDPGHRKRLREWLANSMATRA